MKVNNIQSTSFDSKQRFITPEMKKDVTFLLDKMNEKTTYTSNGDFFRTSIFKAISDKKGNVQFQDGRIYFGDKLERKDLKGEVLFTIGKTELVIDNQTGEIIDYYKPFYTTWNRVMKKIGTHLKFFITNFDSNELVKHKTLHMPGLTEKGWEKFEKIRAGING